MNVQQFISLIPSASHCGVYRDARVRNIRHASGGQRDADVTSRYRVSIRQQSDRRVSISGQEHCVRQFGMESYVLNP